MQKKKINNIIRQNSYFLPLLDIAKESGSIILSYYRNHKIKTNYKSDNSPLTIADLSSHKFIVSKLALISDLPIISEECKTIYTKEDTYWLVDPLDGTKEFLNKNGEFTVNIALIEKGFPKLGIVHLPVSGVSYVGGINLGSIKIDVNNKIREISVSSPGNFIKVLVSRNHLNKDTKNFVNNLGKIKLLEYGSSLKFCLIAEGEADIYPRMSPTSEWDTAAAQAIVEGAGGSVLTTESKRMNYQKKSILNPNFIVRGNNNLKI